MARGHDVVGLDIRPGGETVDFVNADIRDQNAMDQQLARLQPTSIIHAAGLKSVPESVRYPERYRATNVRGTRNVLQAATRVRGFEQFVFASSCSVYGNESQPVTEDSALRPINPYASSKLAAEALIEDFARETGSIRTILRYFNVAGAAMDGSIGERVEGTPAQLIPRVIFAALRRTPPVEIFGDDFPTPDGTALRDFVHVEDLVRAHVLAMETRSHSVLNLGTGGPTSVAEVISAVEEALGRGVPSVMRPRRAGDAVASWAETRLCEEVLGWRATINIAGIVESAAFWHSVGDDQRDPILKTPDGAS